MEATEGKQEKSMRVKSLLLALGLSLVVGKSFAISFKVDGISYVANADTAIIKGYSEIPENGELTLASTVSYVGKDYRVTTVQGSAFLSCTDIKKLIVPANIKYIQSGAFENCVNMNKLVLAEGEERLDAESDAFKNCGIEEATIGRNLKTSIFVRNAILTKVVFGSNIKNIPDNAFYGCSNLSSVDLSNVESIGNSAFASTKLEKVEIPAQLSYLGTSVFSNCKSLTRVSIKANITSIPNFSFMDCSSLSTIEYPATVTLIGEKAFSGCGFTSFKMHENVAEIRKEAFYYCENLENIEWGNVSLIGYNAFEGCGFKELSLPNSLCKVYMNAFRGCKNLVKVDLSRTNVTEIGCFANCYALKEVSFPQNLTGIGYECFKGCSSIVSLNLPSTLETLSGKDFQGMSSLTEIDLSDTKIKSLSSDCFKDCSSLQKIVFPSPLESLNSSALENAIALKEVDLSHTNVHIIPRYCFAGCRSLEQVSLAENTDTIEYQAFAGCSTLAVVKNTDNIKIVYDGAFAKTKLFDEMQNGPAMIGSVLYQYKGTIEDKEYTVPENVTCIAAKALANQNIQSIKLNKELRFIGTGAFDDCTKLLSLTVPGSVEYLGSSTGCSSLSSLTLKEGDKDLELGTFSDNKIKKFYMGRNVSSQLDWMPELENLTIGKYVKSIGSNFSSSEKLTTLELEDADDVLDFGNNPMVDRITSLYMGRNVTVGTYEGTDEYNLDKKVIKGNSFLSLAELSIGEKVTSICNYFCDNNRVLETLLIPHNVKTIGMKAFYRNIKLKELTIEDGVKTIGKLAFGYNDDPFNMVYSPVDKASVIKEISIPSSVKNIEECAFAGVKVEKLNLAEGVGYLGNKCFMYISTDSIVLPSTITLGEWNCFAYSSIKYVDARKYKGKLNKAFTFNGLMSEVLLNDGLKSLDCDFNCCNSLTSIILPSDLETIGSCEFTGVPIKCLRIPENVVKVGGEILESDSYYGNASFVPSVIIEGKETSPKILLDDSFCWSGVNRESEKKLNILALFKDTEYIIQSQHGTNVTNIGMDTLILGNIKEFDIQSTDGKRFVPTNAICLSHYLTSCDMWKPTNGKIFVLPGSQLPAEDVTYMYTVNKLDYEQSADGKVLFDGINNMPYEITPVFYQDGNEVALEEIGTYDLSMKISGTTYDGIYPTGLKVTVASSTGINNVTMDSNASNCPVYNMNGQRVEGSYKGVVIQNGKKRLAK